MTRPNQYSAMGFAQLIAQVDAICAVYGMAATNDERMRGKKCVCGALYGDHSQWYDLCPTSGNMTERFQLAQQCGHEKWNQCGDDLIPCKQLSIRDSRFCAEHQGIHEE